MSTEELTALAKEAGYAGGIYASHVRTINGHDPNAAREAIQIGEGAGVPIHFFHLNSVASTSATEFLKIIHEAQQRGIRVTADAYPYTWGITWLASYLPTWAQAGGTEAMLARLRDPEERKRIAYGFRNDPPYYARIGWDNVRVGVDDLLINGKLVSEVAAMRHRSADDTYMDIVLEHHGHGIVIDKNNEEETLQQVIRESYVAVGTDGWAVDLDAKNGFMAQLPHPRMLATFTKWLARYVREQHLMSWEEAIRRMTALPASVLGLTDRGTLGEGKIADIVVFDPRTVLDRATFPDPKHYSEGILYLFVNGQAVVREGNITGALPGRALRGRGYHATAEK
jgi:N-acyl-D-amino-acid deacylase